MSEKEYQAYIDELHKEIENLKAEVYRWKQRSDHHFLKLNNMEKQLERYRDVMLSSVEKWCKL